MTCQEEYSHSIRLEHCQRIFCMCQCSKDLCMSDIRNFCRMKGFFVDRSSSHCIDLSRICQFNTLCNVFIRCFSAHSAGFSIGKCIHIHVVKIDQVQDSFFIDCLFRLFDLIDLQILSCDLDCFFYDLPISDDDTHRNLEHLIGCNGFCYNLRSYSRRISDWNCNNWFLHFSHPFLDI